MTILKLDHVTKIEGHASLSVEVDGGRVKNVDMAVVEGSRFFEGIANGRNYDDVHLVVQRICGICSVSHTLACLMAVENALEIEVTEQTRLLRELMEIGAIIQSHSLHLYLLALPDYLGYGNAIEMAGQYKTEVLRGLSLKKLGNEIDQIFGGRIMHPVATVLGGFQSYPSKVRLAELAKKLEKAKTDAMKTVELFAGLKYPKFKRMTEYVCLGDEKKYSILGGRIMFSNGLEIAQKDYLKHLKEDVRRYSTAKFSEFEKRSYYVGALARVNNNSELLGKTAQKAIEKYKLKFPSANPYHNNIAQAIEIVHVIDRALEIIKNLNIEKQNPIEPKIRSGRGIAFVEAPRGILIHDYTLDKSGKIIKTNIVTPTAQNLKNIEDDVYKLMPKLLSKTENDVVFELEKLIRSYDPCISCSAHFLKLKIDKK